LAKAWRGNLCVIVGERTTIVEATNRKSVAVPVV